MLVCFFLTLTQRKSAISDSVVFAVVLWYLYTTLAESSSDGRCAMHYLRHATFVTTACLR